MARQQELTQMRQIAIATNMHHISKWVSDPLLAEYNNEEFIYKAAAWMYRKFGFGRCNLDLYFEYVNKQKTKRLYSVNVKEWYRLIKEVFARDNYTCAYCGKVGGKLECDHIIPFSKGGTNELNNLTTSCRKCNRQKKDKSVEEFQAWRAAR